VLKRIGNCRVVEEMASGGMAVVYRAIQDGLERTVAIKALKSAAAAEENLVLRFEREAKALAQLQHENIIHVYDFHREHGSSFIVMEYVQGIDLYDLLERCPQFPYEVAAVLALQVARALNYIHYRGLLHRDIKPANVMLSRQGGVKLMDFGIIQDRRDFGELTQTGTGVGTPAYMSPEQVLGDALDGRSDIFSLGILLYQMVTGTKPFVEDEERSVMNKIRLVQHTRAVRVAPGVPRELDRIIERCLHKKPRERWPSAQMLIMALERFLAKHVAINHHARLVEFLRDQGVVPAFEAEEYLRLDRVGEPASAGSTPNLNNQRVTRRGLLVHAGMLLVMALMVGIIHLAPLGADDSVAALAPPPPQGYVRIVVHPWGRVAVDGQELGITPMAQPQALSAGAHLLTVSHDELDAVEQVIQVPESEYDEPLVVRIDLEDSGLEDNGLGPSGAASPAPRAADDSGADTPADEPAQAQEQTP